MNPSQQSVATGLWSRACVHIRQGICKQTFAQWFDSIVPLTVSETTLELGVSNDFFGDWITQHYGDLITAALLSETGKKAFAFCFTTLKEMPKPEIEAVPEPVKPIAAPVAAAPTSRLSSPSIPEGCDPTYTFDNFVVGDENRIAYFAALKAAQNPGTYNPLFIYGGTSLGKTHLLQSIANEYCKMHPNRIAKYITCEQIMNDYTNAIRENAHYEFRNRYREVDILLVDDVQFLGNKENLQEVFFNTFNTLHHERSQIVLTSDCPPAEINGLADRLVSRFESGLIAQVIPPSYETRLAVVNKYRESYGLRVSNEVLEFLARSITANMRRLIGSMIQVSAYESVHKGQPMTLDVAEKMFSRILMSERSSRRIAVEEVQRKVAEHFDIRLQDLIGTKRTRQIALPRQIAMYLSRKLTSFSYPDIAEAFGGKNHATIIHAFRKIEQDIETDQEVRTAVTQLERLLKD